MSPGLWIAGDNISFAYQETETVSIRGEACQMHKHEAAERGARSGKRVTEKRHTGHIVGDSRTQPIETIGDKA